MLCYKFEERYGLRKFRCWSLLLSLLTNDYNLQYNQDINLLFKHLIINCLAALLCADVTSLQILLNAEDKSDDSADEEEEDVCTLTGLVSLTSHNGLG